MNVYTDEQLEQLWSELSDVPFYEVDGDLLLEDDWFEFEADTGREEIWHWFDERYSFGVYGLMFPDDIVNIAKH